MISEMAQCGPWMLVPAGLGAVGGLLMGLAGWASVKGKSPKVVGGMILAGGVCIFLSFIIPACSALRECYGLFGK